MDTLSLKIDGRQVECPDGSTILEAADAAGIYIPRICYHSDIDPVRKLTWATSVHQVESIIEGERSGATAGDEAHCGLCMVQVDGESEPVNACRTPVGSNLSISTTSESVAQRRREALSRLLCDHPHACLTCAQKAGCSRTVCSMNVPVDERCCSLLGNCELEKVSDYIGIPNYTPRYVPKQLPKTIDDPLFDRDFNLCIGCTRCVRICQEVQEVDVLGAVWKDDRAWIGTLDGGNLKESQCRFCGACVEICPTGALLDKDGAEPVRCDLDLPCVSHCPAGIDIPRYLAHVAAGDDKEALDTIREKVPFPGILGYACFHPCEIACRRSDVDEPVAICALKRYVADAVPDAHSPQTEKLPDTGKKVAIVGSGPAGSTAAYYLSVMGHQVDIFERESMAGGMLRYGIPDYRLPAEVLDNEMEMLKSLGINFHLDHRFSGSNWTNELESQGFDAILIAVGVSGSKNLAVENSELEGIYPALEFLKRAKLSQQPKLDGKVMVIGGGNVAIDAAMTSVRLGADSVDLVCLESRSEMPAHEWEIRQAEEEEVEIHHSWGIKRFLSDNGKVVGVELKRCTNVFDSHGKFVPQYEENETSQITAKHIIVAVGQQIDSDIPHDLMDSFQSSGQTVQIDDNMSGGKPGVYAAGDVIRGPSSIVDAIADGRQVAEKIDIHLGGTGFAASDNIRTETEIPNANFPVEAFREHRQDGDSVIEETRRSGFGVLQQTLTEQQARTEAKRCLQCFIRQRVSPAVLPPEFWQPLNHEALAIVPETEGVVQLLNDDKKVIGIMGAQNLRLCLQECLENPGDARLFTYEEDAMYTKRESELIQQHLQKYGELPGSGTGGDDLDDLY